MLRFLRETGTCVLRGGEIRCSAFLASKGVNCPVEVCDVTPSIQSWMFSLLSLLCLLHLQPGCSLIELSLVNTPGGLCSVWQSVMPVVEDGRRNVSNWWKTSRFSDEVSSLGILVVLRYGHLPGCSGKRSRVQVPFCDPTRCYRYFTLILCHQPTCGDERRKE